MGWSKGADSTVQYIYKAWTQYLFV